MYLSPLKPLWPTPALLSQSPAHNPSSDQSWTHSHESSLEVGKHTVWQYVPEVQRISYSLSGGVIRLLWLSLIPLTNTHTWMHWSFFIWLTSVYHKTLLQEGIWHLLTLRRQYACVDIINMNYRGFTVTELNKQTNPVWHHQQRGRVGGHAMQLWRNLIVIVYTLYCFPESYFQFYYAYEPCRKVRPFFFLPALLVISMISKIILDEFKYVHFIENMFCLFSVFYIFVLHRPFT